MTLLWDVRSAMEEKEARVMQGIIDKHKNKQSYFVHVCANWTDHSCETMKTTYILRSKAPPKILGSKLYKIDNRSGTIAKEWELPMDVLVPGEDLDLYKPDQNVADSMKNIESSIVMS